MKRILIVVLCILSLFACSESENLDDQEKVDYGAIEEKMTRYLTFMYDYRSQEDFDKAYDDLYNKGIEPDGWISDLVMADDGMTIKDYMDIRMTASKRGYYFYVDDVELSHNFTRLRDGSMVPAENVVSYNFKVTVVVEDESGGQKTVYEEGFINFSDKDGAYKLDKFRPEWANEEIQYLIDRTPN